MPASPPLTDKASSRHSYTSPTSPCPPRFNGPASIRGSGWGIAPEAHLLLRCRHGTPPAPVCRRLGTLDIMKYHKHRARDRKIFVSSDHGWTEVKKILRKEVMPTLVSLRSACNQMSASHQEVARQVEIVAQAVNRLLVT